MINKSVEPTRSARSLTSLLFNLNEKIDSTSESLHKLEEIVKPISREEPQETPAESEKMPEVAKLYESIIAMQTRVDEMKRRINHLTDVIDI